MQWFGLSEKEVSQIQQEIKIEKKKEKFTSQEGWKEENNIIPEDTK